MYDIKKSDSKSDKTINLRYNKVIRIPIVTITKTLLLVAFFIVFLVSPTAQAPAYGETINHTNNSSGQDQDINEPFLIAQSEVNSQQSAERRAELENELAELENQIREQEKLISQYRTQGQSLQNEINRLDAEIRSANLQIQAVELSLQRLDQNIVETQQEINTTQDQIEEHKSALSSSVRSLYETDNESLISILLKNGELSDFVSDINNILLVQDNIRGSLNKIVDLRQELIAQKEELGIERSDVENLKAVRENTKRNLETAQSEKETLLTVTRNEESRHQEILEEKRKTAAEVRSQIFRLIGGGELNFESAYELAKLAESATGIRAALTMAILDRESGLGRNVGGCKYNQVVSQTGLPVMHPDRDIPVFESILTNLRNSGTLPPNPTVSCPILSHGNHGGAMGPAQFIPSTWAIYGGYRNSGGTWKYQPNLDYIGDAVGRKPSNPWSNADAFAATSLYIKDLYDSQACKSFAEEWAHSYPRQESQEECASARYYSGSRWRSYLTFYGIEVVKRANEIQRDIDVLTGA